MKTPELLGEAMVYAGRLDPMAGGVLLVLTGADRFALPEHLTHDKEYVAGVLFGVRSDTFDALGRVSAGGSPDIACCVSSLRDLAGTHTLPIPVWSAYKVRGRPLHAWARENRLEEITIPTRAMGVTAVREVEAQELRPSILLDDLRTRILRVRGPFRQSDAIADWEQICEVDRPLVLATATLTVTSGTYIRALANDAGVQLGCGALLFSLTRTRVGPYSAR